MKSFALKTPLIAMLAAFAATAWAAPAGTLLFARGDLQIIDAAGSARVGKAGDLLQPGERVVTRDGAVCQIKLWDGTLVGVRPDTELKFELPEQASARAKHVIAIVKGGLRVAGFPVRTLFPNVLEAKGVGDFWSRRWNVGYSQMMQRLVGRPVAGIAGEGVGVMAVFVGSGLLHELAITLPVRSGFGLPTLYFTLHGILTLVERKWGRPMGKVPALLAVMLPLPWLFPPAFQREVIEACLGVFDLLDRY